MEPSSAAPHASDYGALLGRLSGRLSYKLHWLLATASEMGLCLWSWPRWQQHSAACPMLLVAPACSLQQITGHVFTGTRMVSQVDEL